MIWFRFGFFLCFKNVEIISSIITFIVKVATPDFRAIDMFSEVAARFPAILAFAFFYYSSCSDRREELQIHKQHKQHANQHPAGNEQTDSCDCVNLLDHSPARKQTLHRPQCSDMCISVVWLMGRMTPSSRWSQ